MEVLFQSERERERERDRERERETRNLHISRERETLPISCYEFSALASLEVEKRGSVKSQEDRCQSSSITQFLKFMRRMAHPTSHHGSFWAQSRRIRKTIVLRVWVRACDLGLGVSPKTNFQKRFSRLT